MSWNKLFILQERFEFMEVIKYFFWDYQIIFILTLSKVKWTAFETDLMVEKNDISFASGNWTTFHSR